MCVCGQHTDVCVGDTLMDSFIAKNKHDLVCDDGVKGDDDCGGKPT